MSHQQNLADVSRAICGVELSQHATSDSRADMGVRSVSCDHHSVIIARRLHGISMQLRISARAYLGVVLSIFTDRDGMPFYRISMPHADADIAIVLFEARNDRDVIAVWNGWAQYFALPKLLERQTGQLESGEMRLGATKLGQRPLWRRRGNSLAKRKPKLLGRRRSACAVIRVAGKDCAAPMQGNVSFPPV